VDKFIIRLESQLAERNVQIDLSNEARDWLAEKGYDKQNGARPLARLIAEKIKKPLADEVLFGTLSKGGSVTVVVKDGDLGFAFEKLASAKPRPRNSLSTTDEAELV